MAETTIQSGMKSATKIMKKKGKPKMTAKEKKERSVSVTNFGCLVLVLIRECVYGVADPGRQGSLVFTTRIPWQRSCAYLFFLFARLIAIYSYNTYRAYVAILIPLLNTSWTTKVVASRVSI